MTTPRPIRAAGDHARAALMATATRAIVEEGWQGAGARSVTSLAGVPLGALNYHFGSKEALFREAAMTELSAMFDSRAQAIGNSESVAELVTEMVDRGRSQAVTPRQRLMLLEAMAQSRRDPDLAVALTAAVSGHRRELARALQRLSGIAVGSDGEPAMQVRAMANSLAAHCEGLWLDFVMEPEFASHVTAAESVRVWVDALSSVQDGA